MSTESRKTPKSTVFSRSFERAKQTPILLVSSDRLLSDVELLLEDKWKGLSLASSEENAIERSKSNSPKIVVLDVNIGPDALSRLVEIGLKDIPCRIAVYAEGSLNAFDQKRINRLMAEHGVLSFPISNDPPTAAQELAQTLESSIDRLSQQANDTIAKLKVSYTGFISGVESSGGTWDSKKVDTLVSISMFFFSKFAMTVEDIDIAITYAQTFDFLRAISTPTAQLNQLKDEFLTQVDGIKIPVRELVKLAATTRDYMRQGGFIPESIWFDSLAAIKLGPVASRQFQKIHPAIRELCERLTNTESDESSSDGIKSA